MNVQDKITYVEFPAKDIPATKAFFQKVFGWQFKDYGPDYTAFANQGLDGGFYKSGMRSSKEHGAPGACCTALQICPHMDSRSI